MKTKGVLDVIIPPYENSYEIHFKANAVRVRVNHVRTVNDRVVVAVFAPVRYAFKFKGFRMAVHSIDDDVDPRISGDHVPDRIIRRRTVYL